MRLSFCVIALLFGSAVSSATAATVPCPDLSAAVQVAACPTEEDLQFTFTGFCSDNARMYRKDTDVCTDYQRYRKLKNLALWESPDGEFQSYVSCDLPVSSVKAAKASAMTVTKKAGITQLVCSYGDGVDFTKRTRAECSVEASSNCAANAAACVASCQ